MFVKTLAKEIKDDQISGMFQMFTKQFTATAEPKRPAYSVKTETKNGKPIKHKGQDLNATFDSLNSDREKNSDAPTMTQLDLGIVDNYFEKWYKEEESLIGKLNKSNIDKLFVEFNKKVEFWGARGLRKVKLLKKRFKNHIPELREVLNRA